MDFAPVFLLTACAMGIRLKPSRCRAVVMGTSPVAKASQSGVSEDLSATSSGWERVGVAALPRGVAGSFGGHGNMNGTASHLRPTGCWPHTLGVVRIMPVLAYAASFVQAPTELSAKESHVISCMVRLPDNSMLCRSYTELQLERCGSQLGSAERSK